MSISRNTILATALIIVALGGAAYFLFFNGAPTPAITTDTGPGSDAQATFINLAAQLEPVAFDSSILSNPRFIALQDIHTAIIPEASGRPDPFSALPGVSAVH